ncbi:nicotinate phosphoribosyltransferase [Crossiella equi]|nr:nicotinate phosphoribosyltransferase [Crossiella equi]
MSGLRTDLYEVRMAVGYLRRGLAAPATFSLYVRELPPNRGFLVAAGLREALELLTEFRFDDHELGYLRAVLGLTKSDLTALARLRFRGDVWAVPEGRVVFAGEPLLEVTAPVAQAQLVETALLNTITFQTAVATKAARCVLAAPGARLVDFAARRAQGWDAAMAVARASAIGGFTGTSNLAAARRYGLPPVGTMAHSWVSVFGGDLPAFRAFLHDFPVGAVFLVDTVDTLEGVRTAIQVAREAGSEVQVGVRLDSGDLGGLAVAARRLLDEAGLADAPIVASGGLDEYRLAELHRAGAPIDVCGVGTRLGVCEDTPALDTVYKLVEYDERPTMKLSAGKATVPGAKQVFRCADDRGDVLALREENVPPGGEALLEPVVLGGRLVRSAEPLAIAHARLRADLGRLPGSALRLDDPEPPPVRLSARAEALTEAVRAGLTGRPGDGR